MKACPKCGGKTAEIRQYVHGYGSYYVDLESGNVDCGELHAGLTYKNTRKYAICADCGTRLFLVSNLERLIQKGELVD